jgi:hypothetical protein
MLLVAARDVRSFYQQADIGRIELVINHGTFTDNTANPQVTLDQGGFALKWRTVQRQKGTSENPTEVLKETERDYLPVPGKSFWAAKDSGNPLKGEFSSWAVLSGQSLTVYSMAVRENGTYDMLIYKRTLTGHNMKLDFTAYRNGNLRRTVSGTLIKTGG